MLKKLFNLVLTILLFEGVAFSQATDVEWGRKMIVNDMPGNYGSQYGRLLQLKNGKWLAAYTVSVNAGYRKNPDGGLQPQVSESSDGGSHWKKISRVIDKGRDLDNAELTVKHGVKKYGWLISPAITYPNPACRSGLKCIMTST